MARPFFRNLGTLPYASGQVVTLDIPKNHVFKRLLIHFSGTATIGVANALTLNSEDVLALFPSIRIVRNGSEVLQDLDGGSLYRMALYNNGTAPSLFPIGTVNVGGPYAFSGSIPIDFSSERLYTPSMTLAKAVGTSSFQLQVTFGNLLNVFVPNATTTLSLNVLNTTVHGVEIMDLSGTFADKIIRGVNKLMPSTQADFEMLLTTGPLYRRIFLKSWSAGSGGVPQFTLRDDIINNIRVVVDGSLYLADRYQFTILKEHNKMVYGLESTPAGYAVIDFAEDGNPQGLLNTSGASEVKLLLDVTTANGTAPFNIIAIPEVIVPAPAGGVVPA